MTRKEICERLGAVSDALGSLSMPDCTCAVCDLKEALTCESDFDTAGGITSLDSVLKAQQAVDLAINILMEV